MASKEDNEIKEAFKEAYRQWHLKEFGSEWGNIANAARHFKVSPTYIARIMKEGDKNTPNPEMRKAMGFIEGKYGWFHPDDR